MQATDIAHVIQLAVAPVFLLTGIGALLSVLSARVGRIVDRSRQIEEKHADAEEHLDPDIQCEIDLLSRRTRVAYWAISLCTACALLICTLIVVLFVGAFLSLDVSSAIAILFIAAMAALIIGLYCFLHEIYLATASLRFRWRSRAGPDKNRRTRPPSADPGRSRGTDEAAGESGIRPPGTS
ncbi:uncharacterized protein sS8_0582 [Methylocaldum marinum]|uniref:DUF2721 domain-containing protein n=1 Tax=Methylocaldum marinum TaxID=1432792 RepID=A0A250KLU0_9GAMM|nr:DUF2721 domain-containing protein [Methylocaldum marinum]BBA32547.1 uncharacterized protein sS8_0582 [Methylocaldum marinum]